jgi:virulence-associated protein VapD
MKKDIPDSKTYEFPRGTTRAVFQSQFDASQVEELLSLVREHGYEQQQGCIHEKDDGHELKHTLLCIVIILQRLQS